MAKVLLVDDDQALSTVFGTALEKAGYALITALDGKQGLEKSKTEKPDIILLDHILPDMAGNEVLKVLKQDPETQKIPVAMLSNFGQNELVQEAINNGASEYILKYQIAPEDLVNKINGLLQSPAPNV